MKHIFPRQFDLHNVFTSTVDTRETAQPFKDYTMRDQEISQKDRWSNRKASTNRSHLPRRLRGTIFDLVRKMQKIHSRCAYSELLRHYCPLNAGKNLIGQQTSSQRPSQPNYNTQNVNSPNTTPPRLASEGTTRRSASATAPEASQLQGKSEQCEMPLVDFATPHAMVSAFSRAVISNLVPDDFWGQGAEGRYNKGVVMRKVDQFVCMRRFESLNLHVVQQGLKVIPLILLPCTRSDPIAALVDAVARASPYFHGSQDIGLGSWEAKRASTRISILSLRLDPDSSHSFELPRHRVKSAQEPHLLFPT